MSKEREWKFLLAYADYPDTGVLHSEQLRALWTAFCIHRDLLVDTNEYDVKLISIYGHLYHTSDTAKDHDDFNTFYNYMSEFLC